MYTRFTASESLEMAVREQIVPIYHYLRQPQRLVSAITDPKLMKQLGQDRYELKMRPLNFMELYHFQPIVVLKVSAGANGTVYLNSERCKIEGIDYINDRFSLKVKGFLLPQQRQGKTYLQGQANLDVTVELPPALWITPKPLLEITGQRLLKSVLLRIKQRLLSQLLQDYYLWANDHAEQHQDQISSVLPEIS